jgi:creatinine amidohydrolase
MSRPLLILPLGSTEQHGPHLPIETDSIIVDAVVAQCVDSTSADVHIAPTMNVTASDEHLGFPGTLSIGTEATTAAVVALCRAAFEWTRGVLIVNGHGGNHDALVATSSALTFEGVAHRIWNLPAYNGADMHAGHTETSLMLHIAPTLVRRDAIEPGNTSSASELIESMRSGGVRSVSANGVLGDPTTATAEHGAQVLRLYAQSLESAIAQCLNDWNA